MKNITIDKFSQKGLEEQEVLNWPIWTIDISKFYWLYNMKEQFYSIEGDIIVKTIEANIHIQAGDFVTTKNNLDCVWIVKQRLRKHYNFQ